MPLSQPRLALAGIFTLLLALFLGAPAARAVGPGDRPLPAASDNPIVARALQDLDTWQGQCWPWVQRVIADATGRKMGFDYYWGFVEGGAYEVTLETAAPGDVVQIADPANTAPDADYIGLHTGIIIAVLGPGAFTIIDSNGNWDEMVRIRNGEYRPAEMAASKGMKYWIWRFPLAGQPAGGPPAPAAPTAPADATLRAGDTARVNVPANEYLNFRSAPGVDPNTVKGRLYRDNTVTILEAPKSVGGYAWVKVRSEIGEGYVAAEYLAKVTASAPASGTGSSRPILLYRSFAPAIAASSSPD